MKKEEKGAVELSEMQLEQISGGTVKNDGDKAAVNGTKTDIEDAVDKINYEAKIR